MKPLVVVFATLSLSISHVVGFGIGSLKPASAQLFRCDDTSLGDDEREEIRGEDSRRESRVAIGTNCRDANYHEYLNERNRREAELERQRMQDWDEKSKRTACEFYGINSPNCTHEGLRQQAREEEDRERARQIEAAQIQQEAQRENNLRQAVAAAQAEVRSIQESIIFWREYPDNQQQYKEKLPLAEANLQRAEQELQNYLTQKSIR